MQTSTLRLCARVNWFSSKRERHASSHYLNKHPAGSRTGELYSESEKLCLIIFSPCLPAETNLLVDHQRPLQGPTQPVLKPALTAEHGRQADGRRHVAGRAALSQVGQQEAGAGALAHGVQSPRRLLVADVADGLAQVGGVAELLQFDGGEGGPVVAAAVKNHREVAVEESCFTKL